MNTCSLSYEELIASTDLSGKVASASALKSVNDTYKRRLIGAEASNPLNLDNCKDFNTTYYWDYAGSKYVTSSDASFQDTAGAINNFPNLGSGITQVYVQYLCSIIKVRCWYKHGNQWSSWCTVTLS